MGAPSSASVTEDDFEYHKLVDTSVDKLHGSGYEVIASCTVTFVDDKAATLKLWYAVMS
jgi:hypothetical protein